MTGLYYENGKLQGIQGNYELKRKLLIQILILSNSVQPFTSFRRVNEGWVPINKLALTLCTRVYLCTKVELHQNIPHMNFLILFIQNILVGHGNLNQELM
jgi:hypothetical protein